MYLSSGVYSTSRVYSTSSQINSTSLPNIASGSTIIQSSTTTTYPPTSWIFLDSANGTKSCAALMAGQNGSSNWNNNVCTVSGSTLISNFVLNSYMGLVVARDVKLVLDNIGGGYANYGEIINNGTIEIESSFGSYGLINNYGTIWTNGSFANEVDSYFMPNGGTINNYGAFEIVGYLGQYPANYTVDQNGTTIDYSGKTFLYGGNFANDGIINNYGIMNNSGVLGNFMSGSAFNSTINNYGKFVELPGSSFQNEYFIGNSGSIVDEGSFANTGKIVDTCGGNFAQQGGGTFSGNPIIQECLTGKS